MTRNLIAGIDIGGTKIAVALADAASGETIFRHRFPTVAERGAKAILAETTTHLDTGLKKNNGNLVAVGIGCAGPLDIERGLAKSPPNLPGWDEFPIIETVAEHFRVPVILDNDANAAAIGEYTSGAGRGLENLVYMTISTGIGGGVITGGKIVRGVGAGAGEIGHITVAGDKIRCGCGGYGCLEAVASGTNIARRAGEAVADCVAESLLSKEPITAQKVVEAARNGDALAQKVWDETICFLAVGLNAVIVTLAPEAIIIGGGVSLAGEAMLFEPLRREVQKRVKIAPVERIKILPAGLKDESGIYGALALARTAAFIG